MILYIIEALTTDALSSIMPMRTNMCQGQDRIGDHMKSFNLKLASVIACLSTLCAPSALAQDWSQWRGDDHDGKVSGFTAPELWPSNLKLGWKVTVGEGDSSPALLNGKLFVFARQGNQEIIRCLDATSGKEIWRATHDSIELKGAARSHSGPRSSPAVADGKVVTLGVAGILTCLDTDSGKVLWRKNEFPDDHPAYYTAASPLVVDGMCIAQLGGKQSGAIIAYDLNTGRELWRWEGDSPAYASPVMMTVEGNKQVVALTAENVVGISATDGQLLWQTPFSVPRMSTNSATPVVDGRTVIFSGQDRGINAVRIEKSNHGYTVEKIWSNNELSTAFNTPVLNDHLLFGLSHRTNLYCLDTRTGDVLWIDDARHERFGVIVNAGGTLFALPSNGTLTVYEAIGAQYKQLAQYEVSESPTYSYPVISGNRVYIQDQDSVTAWTIE